MEKPTANSQPSSNHLGLHHYPPQLKEEAAKQLFQEAFQKINFF